jgi:hypothetical protein
MREIDLGFDLVAFNTVCARCLGAFFALAGGAKVRPHLLRFVFLKRTGMRLFLGDADGQQHIENSFTFDFQLPGQIVNSNLAHPAPFFSGLSR